MKKFEMPDLGLLHFFLRFEGIQCDDGIFIFQWKYVTDLLKRFNMLNCKSALIPMNVNESLIVEDGTGLACAKHFRSMVCGLNYLSHTRPDIAFFVGVISRFMHNPTVHHLGTAKRILCYVAGTIDFGIWYSNKPSSKLFGFTDSVWAGCFDDRKNTSAYVFSLWSGAVSWSSKKQETVALSSSEAEYVATTASTCQAIWFRVLLGEFHPEQTSAT